MIIFIRIEGIKDLAIFLKNLGRNERLKLCFNLKILM